MMIGDEDDYDIFEIGFYVALFVSLPIWILYKIVWPITCSFGFHEWRGATVSSDFEHCYNCGVTDADLCLII